MEGAGMDDDRAVDPVMRSFSHDEFDVHALVGARGRRKISVCLPARNEERTVGRIVSIIRRGLTTSGGGAGLVEEIVVVDDASVDSTASVAREAGARVVRSPGSPERGGKGEAMRAGLAETTGDIVVFLDADVENFGEHFVTGLVGPLLTATTWSQSRPVVLVKGFYERPLNGEPSGGGRVTELVARPAIELLFPQLRDIRQPLAGESAAPREVLEKTGIGPGYGAEMGLLLDVSSIYGAESVAQVDLGVRIHRNRPLEELRHQAVDVLRAALSRADLGHSDRL
jgi:glucosyl-3-phosphoglycerate synthase